MKNETVVFSRLFVHEYVLTFLYPTLEIFPKKRFENSGKTLYHLRSVCLYRLKIHQISTSLAKKANSRDSRTVCFENARLAILHFVRGINRARSFKRGCNTDLVIRYWASAFLAKTKTGAFYSTWVAFYSAGVFHRISTCVLEANPTCEIPLKICRQSCE